MRGRVTDLCNRRYGRLLVLVLDYIHPGDGAYWKCQCDCGALKTVRGSSLVQEKTKSCGCLRKTDACRNKLRKGKGEALLLSKYSAYKAAAAYKDRVFELTLDQFKQLTEKPCYYCKRSKVNAVSSEWDTLHYNGIDRMDNDKGYEIGNCLPCCGPCNMMKGKLSAEEFINQIRLIASNLADLK